MGAPCPNCARFAQFEDTARALGKIQARRRRSQRAAHGRSGAAWWMRKAAVGDTLAGQDAALPVGDRDEC